MPSTSASSDFSYEAEFLYDTARSFTLPLVSSNLKTGAAGVPILPYRILQRGEWRLGILGVAPEDGTLFDDPSDPAAPADRVHGIR